MTHGTNNDQSTVVASSGSYQSSPSASPKIVNYLTRKRWAKEITSASPYRGAVSKSYYSKTTVFRGRKRYDFMLFQKSTILKAEVIDVLVQHHLFSWDL